MSKKSYNVSTTARTARPRSKRLRALGGTSITVIGGVGGGAGAVGGETHSHTNKVALDALSIDPDDYLYISQYKEATQTSQPTKARAGYADQAGHAATADDALRAEEAEHAQQADNADKWDDKEFSDYLDQPVRKGDKVQLGQVTTPTLVTPDFTPGGFAGAGAGLTRDANGQMTLEVDNIVARRKLNVNEVIINQSTHVGGRTLFSAANMECVRVEDGGTYWRCYFDTKNGQKANLWQKDDLAYYQQYSPDNTQVLRYYWRLVTSVGEDWINLSKTTCDTGSDAPAEGDNIVQVGNLTDRCRQSMLEIDMMGASRVVLYAGISTFSFVDRNEGALGVDEAGNPYFYCYGDSFLGDRDLSDPDATYITFQTPEGETRRRMIVSADLHIGRGSTGLANLSEWQSKQAEIDRAGQAAAEAKDKVDNLQPGDRNLLLQSNKGWDTSEYRTALIELGDYKPKAGEECTLVVKGRLGEGKVYFGVYNSSGLALLTSITSGDFDSSGIAVKTFPWNIIDIYGNTSIHIYALHNTVVVSSQIEWAKLVVGNKTSAVWTPAPEDTKAEIDNIQVGSVNLVDNSYNADCWTGNSGKYLIQTWNHRDWMLYIQPGKTYTLVSELSVSDDFNGLGVCFFISGGEQIGKPFNPRTPTVVSVTFTAGIDGILSAYHYPGGSAGVSRIKWVKLVEGNKSDNTWSESPADTKAYADQAAAQVQTSAVNYLKDSRYDNLNHWITAEGTVTLVEDPKFGTVVQYQRTSGSGNFQLEAAIYNRSQLSNCDVIYYVIAKQINGGSWGFGGWPDTVIRLTSSSNSIDLGDGWRMYWVSFKAGATLGAGTFGINSITGTWQFYAAGVSLGKNPPSSWTIAEGNLTDSIEIVNSVIADIASDNKLTASEKQTTYNEWQMIAAEYPSLVAEAQKLNVNTANYTSVYTALDSYLKPLVSNLSTTSDIDGNVFRAKFKAYYDAKIALMQQTQGALSDGKQLLFIDASGLDANTYYPLTFKLSTSHRASLRVSAALYINTAPWASHHSKTFSLDCKWSSIGGGWGSNYISRYVEAFRCRWTLDDQTPVGNIGQFEPYSLEYIYVRGGGTYSVQVTNASDITLHKQGYVDAGLEFSLPPLPMSAIVVPKVDIDDLHLTADQSKQRLDRWASDDIISPVEKTGLRQQRAAIEAEYAQLKAEAERYSVSTQPYEAAYNAAIAALDKYTQSSPAEISVVPAEYAHIAAYYTAAEGIRNSVGQVSDVSYLRKAFGKGSTDISGGVVLSEFIGIKEGDKVVGGMTKGSVGGISVPLLFTGADDLLSAIQTATWYLDKEGVQKSRNKSRTQSVTLSDGGIVFANIDASGREVEAMSITPELLRPASFDKPFSDPNVGLIAEPAGNRSLTIAALTNQETRENFFDSYAGSVGNDADPAFQYTRLLGDNITLGSSSSVNISKFTITLKPSAYYYDWVQNPGGGPDWEETRYIILDSFAPTVSITLHHRETGTRTVLLERTFASNTIQIPAISHTGLAKGTYYIQLFVGIARFYFDYPGNGTRVFTTGFFSMTESQFTASWSGGACNSKIFGNGFLFSKTSNSYCGMIGDERNFVFEQRAGSYGFRADNTGSKVWCAARNEWIPADRVLYKGWGKGRGGLEKAWSYKGTLPTAKKLSPGVYEVDLRNPSLEAITHYLVRCTGTGTAYSTDHRYASPNYVRDEVPRRKGVFNIITVFGNERMDDDFFFEVVDTSDLMKPS